MNTEELINAWKAEERIAHIHGWDFSHIRDRYTEEEDLPWNYRETILRHLNPEMRLLDIDTGGGEFLLSLNHPYGNTAATEGYPPNVELCRQTLLPQGIDFRPGDGRGRLPFDDCSFDMVINRHGDFSSSDIFRLLKPVDSLSPSKWVRKMTGSWWNCCAVKQSCRFRSSIWISPPGSFGRRALRFWRRGSAIGPSGFMMLAHWYGLPGSSNGSSQDFQWTPAGSVC